MNIVESFRIAMRSLGANKMRAGLTMLGVIIGVAAVIALVSIGRGMSAAVTAQVESIGTNLLFVRPGSSQQGGVRGAEGSAGTLTLEGVCDDKGNLVRKEIAYNGTRKVLYPQKQ